MPIPRITKEELKAKMDKKDTPKFERIHTKIENSMIRNRNHDIQRSWNRR